MNAITGLLITVRTAKQGTEMVCGKDTEKYKQEIATLRVHEEDLAELGLGEQHQALLSSAHGEVVVTCRAADVPRGLFFLPLGQVANQLFSAAATDGTGVPEWKRLAVRLSPCPDGGGQ